MREVDIVIVGGGPAALAAAVAAHDQGADSVVMLERDSRLGGILNQCIHNGFGLHAFGEELTGPEYAARFLREIEAREIPRLTGTMVLEVTRDLRVKAVNEALGPMEFQAKAVILACGCRERPRGAINIPGSRGAGVFSAGTAQKLVNIDGYLPGREVVILGSGDIGLIMARRMTFEGAHVNAVVELMPYSSGLNRNIVQCLNDFDIPLLFSHTVVQIHGKERVEGVTVAEVDKNLKPKFETCREIPCDTLLLSVGLLPENELARGAGVALSPATGGAVVDDRFMTNVPGIFACGNVLHVHDLVDYVSEESAATGLAAAKYAKGEKACGDPVPLCPGEGVRYVVPSFSLAGGSDPLTLRMRVKNVYRNVTLTVKADGKTVAAKKRLIVAPGEMETFSLTAEQSAAVRASKRAEVLLEGIS